jgi:hypothetical protein
MLGRESSRVYIKSVTCAGFKSSGDTKQTFSFGPGVNLIAGCVHLSFSLNHLIRAPMLRIFYLPRLIDSRPVLIKLRTCLLHVLFPCFKLKCFQWSFLQESGNFTRGGGWIIKTHSTVDNHADSDAGPTELERATYLVRERLSLWRRMTSRSKTLSPTLGLLPFRFCRDTIECSRLAYAFPLLSKFPKCCDL